MAMTQTQKTEAYQFFIIAFGSATGVEYMNQLNDAYAAGMTTKQIVNVYTTKPQFEAVYPRFLSNEQFADKLIENVVGASATAAAKTQAKADVAAALNAGWTQGDVIYQIFTNLAAKNPADADWGGTSQMLANKVAVAAYVTETLLVNTTDLNKLGALVANVTKDPASVAAAEAAAVGANGQTFTLTINQDNFVGNTGNDTFVAGAAQDGAGLLINTLQDVDSLDGGAGTDTLQATVTDAGTAAVPAAAKIAPTLKNIENIEVRFVGAQANELSLVGATGVQSITVANSTNAGGVVSNVGAAANLAVKNQQVAATFKGNTATTLNLGLDTFGTKAAAKTVTVDDVATTLNVTANNAYATVTGTTKAKTLSVAATGANVLTLTPTVTDTLTVTGAGSVEFATAFAALKTLNASANTGGVTATVDDDAVTVNGGAGADKITYTAAIAATAKVDLGAGNDVLTIAGASLKGAVVNGGDGVDTLAVTSAAHLNADSKAIYTGFEVLQVSNGGLVGTTESFDPTQVTGITSYNVATSSGAVELKNLAAAPVVTVKGDVAGSAGLILTLKDATGVSDAVTVTLDNGKTDTTVVNNGVVVSKLTALGVETINLHSNGLINKVGALEGTANKVTNDVLNVNLSKVVIDGSQAIEFVTGATTVALTVDATAATGKVTVTGTAATALLNINGGAGNDVIAAGTKGGLIYGGAGADAITLGADVDTLVYKSAAESQLAVKADGTLDTAKLDAVTGFTTTVDKIDLTSLGFTANTQKVVLEKTVAATDAALWALATSATFFQDATNIARGVVAVSNGTDTYLFADANKDGVFNAANDLVIKLAGLADATKFDQVDVIFG